MRQESCSVGLRQGEAWQAASEGEIILVGDLQAWRRMAYHVAFLQ